MSKPRSAAQLANDERLRNRPVRARPERIEVRTQERRRRKADTIDKMAGFSLDQFSPDQLDLPNYVYRWVQDDGARMRIATKQDDYDPVLASEIKGFDIDTTDSEGSETVRMITGRRENGSAIYSHLLKKPRKFFEEDMGAGVQRRADMLAGRVVQGATGGQAEEDRAVENAYVVPGSGIGGPGGSGARTVDGSSPIRTGRVA